jgi:hypothetical protein
MGRASGSQEAQESIEEQAKETELVATQARTSKKLSSEVIRFKKVGPSMTPAISSPVTAGSLILSMISPPSLATRKATNISWRVFSVSEASHPSTCIASFIFNRDRDRELQMGGPM